LSNVSMFSRSVQRSVGFGLSAVLLVVSVAACTTGGSGSTGGPVAMGQPTTAGTYPARVPVVQPGRPGEPATTLAPGQSGRRAPEASWNGADLYFVSMMVLHHTQALRMARLADGRASDPRVRAVAERITAAQAPEILTLKAWLSARGQKIPDSQASAGHRHGDMPGEVTPARMAALERADGAQFDRLFLDLMRSHHAGAVQMAADVTTAGSDLTVQEIAAETSVGQAAEIRRMDQVRTEL
jgi:uncharacterized protein (DUF305 family)